MPLSVEIKKNPLGEFNPVFHSSSIQEEMEKKRNELMGLGEKNGGGQQQPFTPFRPRHKRLTHGSGMFPIEEETNLKRKLPDIPTVCFPKDVSFQNETSMIFNASANNSSVLNESASHSHLQGSFLDSTPPPFKKSRRLTQLPELSPDGVRRMSRMSTAGLLSLLETPKIVKKTPRRSLAANGSSSALLSKSKAGASSSNTPAIATPQSILKVKRLMSAQEQTPPPEDAIAARVLDMSGANGEDEAWLTTPRTVAAISANSRSRESTPGKSLRFHVPKSLPKDILELDESLDSTKKTDEESSPAAANAHDVSGSEQEEAASEQDDSVRDVSVDDTENRYDQDSAGRSSTAVSNERIVTKHHDDDDLEEDEEVSFAPSTSRTLQNDDGDKASEAPESDDDLEVLETSNSRIEDEKNYQASKDSVETLPEQDEDDDDVESEKEKTSSENANTESKAEQDKISGKAPDNLSKKSIPELEFSDSEESTPEAADKMESESSDAQPEAEIEPKEASPAPRGTLSRIPDLVFSETEETPAKEVQNSAATFALVEDEARDKATTKTLTAKGTLAPIPSMEFSDSEDSDAIEKEVKKSPEEDRFVAATSEYKKSTVAVATTTSEVKLDEATAMKGPIAPIPPLEFSDSEDSAKETEDLKKTNAQNVEGADSTTSSSSYKVIETAAIRGAIAPIPELEFSDSEDLEIPEKKLGENRKEKKKEGNKSSDIEADAVPALGAKLDIPELKFSDSEGEEDRLPSSSPKQVALKTSSTSDIESSTTSIAYESKFAKTSAAIDNVEPEKEKSSKSMEDYSNESEVGTKITGDDDDDQIEVERPRSSIGQILLETAKAFTAKRVSRGKDELEMEAEECSTRNEAGTSSADSVSTKPVSRSNFEEVEDSAKDPSTPKRVSRSNKVMEQTEIVQNDAEESSKVSTRRISRSKAVENEVPKATPARRSSRSQSNASSTTIENEKEEINNKPPSRRTSRSSAVREIIEEKDVKTKRVSRSSKAEEVSESADSQEANSTTMLEPLDEVVPDEIEQTTANETEAKVESEPEKPAISGTRASRSSTTAQIEASETTVSTRRSSRSSKLEVTNNDVTDGKPEKKTRTSRSNTSTSILEEGVKTVATRRSSRSNSSVQAATEENVASSTKRTSRSSKSGSSPGQHSYADCSKRTPSPPRRVSRVAVETTDSSSDEKEASEDQQQPIVRLSPAELVKTMPRSSRRVSRSSKLEDVPENEVSTTTSTARQVAQQIESIAEEEEEKSSSRRRTSRSSISSVATQEKKESPKKKRTSRSSIASTTLEDASDEPAAKKRTTRSKSSVEKDAETPGRSAASKRSSRSSRVEDEQEAEAEQGMGKKRTSRSSRAATEEPKATPSASKKRTSRSSAAANQTDDKNVPPSSSKRTSRSRKTQPEVEEQHLAEVDDVAGGEEEYDPMADDSPPLTRAAAKGIGGRTRSRDSTDAKPKLVLKDPFTPAPKKRTSRRGGATSELETISEKGKEEEKKTKYKVAPIRPRTGRMPK